MSNISVLVIGDNPDSQLRGHRDKLRGWALGWVYDGEFPLLPNKRDGFGGELSLDRLGPRQRVDMARHCDINWKCFWSECHGIMSHAIIHDGEWLEIGDNPVQWGREWQERVNGLPGNTLLSMYECEKRVSN